MGLSLLCLKGLKAHLLTVLALCSNTLSPTVTGWKVSSCEMPGLSITLIYNMLHSQDILLIEDEISKSYLDS